MADSEGIGFSIEIPDKVFKDLQKVDAEIAKLQTTADNTAKSVVGSFKMMADGVNPFIERLKQANNGIVNIPSTLSLAANSGNSFSNSINKATVSLSQFAAYWEKIQNNPRLFSQMEKNDTKAQLNELKQTWNELQNVSRKITQANREMALLAKQAAANTRIESQKVTTETKKKIAEYKKEEAQLRLNNAAYNNYIRAMSMSEQTLNSRTQKIERLKNVMAELAKEESKYSKEIEAIKNKMAALAKENTNVEKSLGKVSERHRSLMNTSDQLARKLALIFSVSQVSGYLKNMIEVRGEFEKQQTALTTILQNKEDADRLFAQITELAVKSPFQLKELITYTKQLAAYRVETEKLFDTTKMLADISSGLGVSMDRLILAYGQVKAANYLRGSELRQFSEAGVNILGELSKYFTELEGNIVSVGDVFERVTKRMVTFEDVDQIFKRLTSEGGIFYQMQEKQAETIAGQISNLRDSLDIMFNDIGKSSDSAIRIGISSIRTLIENWETLVVVLKSVSVGLLVYATRATMAAVATKALATASTDAFSRLMRMKNIQGIQLVFAKLGRSITSFIGVLKANPFALLAAGATAAGLALYEYNKKVEEARATYDSLTNVLNRNQKELDNLVQQYKKNNTEISNLKTQIKGLSQGSEEYKTAQEKLTKAQRENSVVLNKLKVDFPEVYKEMMENKGGVEDLVEAQKNYNEQLEKTRALNILMQQGESWFNEGIKTDLADLAETNGEYNKSLQDLKGSYEALVVEAQKAMNSNSSAAKSYAEQILEISKGTGTTIEKMTQINKVLETASTNFFDASGRMHSIASGAMANFSKSQRTLTKDTKEAQREISKLIENVIAQSGVATEAEFKALDEESKKKAASFAKAFIDEIPSIKDKFIQDFVNQEFKAKLGITFEFTTDVDKEWTGMQKQIKEFIEKNKLSVKVIDTDESQTQFFDRIKSRYKEIIEEEKKLQKATQQRQTDTSNKERLATLQKEKEDVTKLLKAYGEFEEPKGDKKTNNIYKERIDLIKKVGEEYNKLRQYMGDAEATATLRLNYEEAFDQAGIGDLFATMSFDANGIIDSLKKIAETGGKEASKEAQKIISQLENELVLKVKVEETENLSSELDNMFAQYDFGKELEKLGIGKELGKQFFGVDAFGLDELKKNLESYKKSLGELGEKQAEEFEKAEKKVTEMQRKENEERLKRYVGYLKQSVSERLKIEMQAQKDLAKLEEEDVFDQATKDKIRNSIEIEKNKALDALSWKEFQSSDMYISMFEDLERNSSKSLEIMLEKLNQLRSSLNNLSPTELKDITSQIKKIQDELEQRNPFKDLLPNLREYIDYLKVKNDLESQYESSVDRESSLEANVREQSSLVALREEEYNNAVKLYGVNSDQAKKAKTRLNLAKDILSASEGELKEQQEISKNLLDQIKSAENLRKKLSIAFESAGQYANELSSAINDIAGSLEGIFGTMSDKMTDTISSFTEIVGGVGEMASGAGRLLSGDIIGGSIQAIKGLVGTISSIFQIGDKKKEREIQRQIELVEKLQQSYEKLEKAIEDAYSSTSIKVANDMALASINQQIAAYEKMIAAESDKKKTDQDRIDEWEQTIEDLREEQQQLQENFYEQVGGFGSESAYKSAAEEFANAWYDAFLETGDGLSGLEESFDDFMNNVVKKQLLMRGTEKILEPLLKMIDNAVADTILSKEEYDEITKEFDENVKEKLDELYKMIVGQYGIEGGQGETGELSSLSKGIQGLSESTAQALEALLNSMRFFVADSNTQLKSILAALTSQDAVQNPMLAELKMQTKLVSSINSLFASVIGNGHPNYGGKFLKVSM